LRSVRARVTAYRIQNGLASDEPVPVDAVTASASGLDPHISVANARLQAPRVARARGLPLARVRRLVDESTDEPALGFLGKPGVNVLRLNLAVQRAART
jgi:K+-transporting ATPase ATPase C chain